MRVLVVSGIWPPDIGGPASHAPEVAEHLGERGYSVEVVTTASAAPPPSPYPVRWTSRLLPVGIRHLHGVGLIERRARKVEVVYSTGMFGRTMLACALARRPYVLKLTGDPAFERARWRGSFSEDVDAFQRSGSAPWLRRLRDLTVRRAAHILCPSAYMRDLAVSWGADASRAEVLPNPAPAPPREPREVLRRRHGFEGPTLVFAGRLTAQKALDVAIDAVARAGGVTFVVAGEGPERERLEHAAGDRVRFLGPVARETALELLAAADAALLSSGWENFPHAAVEALAVGTPVIATDVGGVGEVVRDGENGLLAPPGDAAALADAIGRFVSDTALREGLHGAAAASAEPYAADRLYARLEAVLEAVVRP